MSVSLLKVAILLRCMYEDTTVQQYFTIYIKFKVKKNECRNFYKLVLNAFFLYKLKLWLLQPSRLAKGQTTLGNGHLMNRYVLMTFPPRDRHSGVLFSNFFFFPYIYKYINSTLFLPFKSFLQNSNFSKIYIMKLPEICLRPPGKLK